MSISVGESLMSSCADFLSIKLSIITVGHALFFCCSALVSVSACVKCSAPLCYTTRIEKQAFIQYKWYEESFKHAKIYSLLLVWELDRVLMLLWWLRFQFNTFFFCCRWNQQFWSLADDQKRSNAKDLSVNRDFLSSGLQLIFGKNSECFFLNSMDIKHWSFSTSFWRSPYD